MIKNIEEKCIGIDINLGFIGQKDVAEIYENEKECVNIDFTKDYKMVKKKINNIIVGGGDDTAEHIVWAFEKTLEKKWKSNARFSILVTDAPCHGLKYHKKDLFDNYPNGVSNSKNIEDLVEDMAKKDISLICIKLKDDTDIMYKIFEDIYKKYKIIFNIIELHSPKDLIDIVINKALEVYDNQRIKDHN